MRLAIGLLCGTLLLAGCSLFSHKPASDSKASPAPAPAQQPKTTIRPVVQPDLRVSGQVAMVNTDARFVIITFPPGSVPAAGQSMNIYHNGLKTGEVKITGPQRENDTVADIVSGDVLVHDQARGD